MTAEIIAIGSEMLTGDRVDTNSLYLTAELNKLGGARVIIATVTNADAMNACRIIGLRNYKREG